MDNGDREGVAAGMDRRGRVLMLVENLSVPTDRRVWLECRTLVRAGHEVVVIGPQGRVTDRERFTVSDGVTIHRFPLKQAAESRLGYLSEYAWAFRHTRRLVRKAASEGPIDVVHAANPPDFLLVAARSLKRRGTRFIFDQHDLVPELYLSRFEPKPGTVHRLTLAMERLSFRLADVVISPNASYARIATVRGKKREEDVFVVRNGPDLNVFRPVEPDSVLKRGKRHLLAYVGVMGKQDGLDEAMRALAILNVARNDWHALFIGDGDAARGARALADELGLGAMVEFTGFLSSAEIVRILSTADVCLSPEPSTPLNDLSTFIKIAEYMSLSRAIVAYDLAETRHTAAAAAAYAKPGDTAGFAGRIVELLDDPERRSAMGRVGRARVEAELAWEHSEPVLLAAYDRVLRGKSLPRQRAQYPADA